MSQFALPLDQQISNADDGYVVSAANEDIHAQLKNWRAWPNLTAILIGPAQSGKSAMAREFQRESGGFIVEIRTSETGNGPGQDGPDDDELFHLWNRAQSEQRPLLLVAEKPVAEWNITLADLKSRLAASLLLEIGPPDEAMISGILHKYFAVRGLSISEDAAVYLSKRMERTYHHIQLLAQRMDRLAIERKKPITRAIAQEALAQSQSEDQAAELD